MSRPRKYNLPAPPPTTVSPSPAEIIELTGKRKQVRGTPVELVSAGPPLEIIEASAVPRLQLEIDLLLPRKAVDPATLGLSTVRFVAAVQGADRRLRLTLDPERTRTAHGELKFILVPDLHRVETARRLERVAAAVPQLAAMFERAVLRRVEITPRE
jgi:hypothetical protein